MPLSERLAYFSDPATQELLIKEMSAGPIMAAFGALRVGRLARHQAQAFIDLVHRFRQAHFKG